ncbi:hypothetical protein CTA1_10715 [Colletotrichum tanaceti]|uniref:Uncharacterized protein n=1 Tax=Colletotrichum tanaceti TaxID=1306861 RepID=A0A4U6X675_9PEZI|nr:hypothetical protein CTA1_10715 [Colletotrichum tanaceti]
MADVRGVLLVWPRGTPDSGQRHSRGAAQPWPRSSFVKASKRGRAAADVGAIRPGTGAEAEEQPRHRRRVPLARLQETRLPLESGHIGIGPGIEVQGHHVGEEVVVVVVVVSLEGPAEEQERRVPVEETPLAAR